MGRAAPIYPATLAILNNAVHPPARARHRHRDLVRGSGLAVAIGPLSGGLAAASLRVIGVVVYV
jgi:hypothetical protein